jgi:hypothetical protein
MAASEMVRIPNELVESVKQVVALWRSGDAVKVEDAISQIASGEMASTQPKTDILPLVQRMAESLETIAVNSMPDIVSRDRLVTLYNLNLTQLENQSYGSGPPLNDRIAQETGWRNLGNGTFARQAK